MGLDSQCPELLLHLRQDYHARLRLVLVLGGENLLHLVVQVVLLADTGHAFYHFIMIDSLDGLAEDIVLLVRAAERVERHHLDIVVLEIELHGGSRCC